MGNGLFIRDELLVDERLKPQEVFLFMHLVRLCDKETGLVNISAMDLMKETRFTNKGMLLSYVKSLCDFGYIERLENVDKKAVYKLKREYYFK